MFTTNLRLGLEGLEKICRCFLNDSYNSIGLEFGKLLEKNHITLYTYKIKYVSIVCLYGIGM